MIELHAKIKEVAGKPEGQVLVNINYDIIKQMSAQLYTNPRKAIEELVCNGYDAGATECHVKLPLNESDSLVVLDDGVSMDLNGLRDLWMVAKSPKLPDQNGRRVGNNRLQIGKFGVGKLAAYALGSRLTHVATVAGVTRVVSVGEDEIKEQQGGRAPKFEVYKMPESQARQYLEPYLGTLPRPWDRGWDSWTIAVVEGVESGNIARALKIGILRRMITAALPISKSFKVVLEGETVPIRKIEQADIELTIDIGDAEFRKKLESNLRDYWQKQLSATTPEDVPASYYKLSKQRTPDPLDVSKELNAINVPHLGPVVGNAILAKHTLTTEKLDERGYVSHGFAVKANGKLVNPEDELFGISPRSHAYWRRFLARVEMPGLDDVLLVQRNAVSEKNQMAQVAREVLRTLFEYTRTQSEAALEADEVPLEPFGSKVSKIAPMLAPLALEALSGGTLPTDGPASVKIDFVTLKESNSAAQYDATDHTIQVNVEHPIIAALNDLQRENQKQWRRVIGEIVAGGKLVEGLLIARAVRSEVISEVEELLDTTLRSAASFIRDPVEEHIREIDEASYEGGTRFENAVVNALRSMRLVAWHIGGADNPDGIVEIPRAGAKNLRISIEAKGTKGVITHTELSQATVARHEMESGCTSSVAIAREYQTEGIGGQDSGLVRETQGKLPLLTVSAISKMLKLQQKRRFTYDMVAKILTIWTDPEELDGFVEETWRQLPETGLMRLILEVAHDKIANHEENLPDPGMLVDDPRLAKLKIKKEAVIHVLQAVAFTTRMITIQNTSNYEFTLNAPVETILDAMTKASQEQIETTSKSKC